MMVNLRDTEYLWVFGGIRSPVKGGDVTVAKAKKGKKKKGSKK
jgi:hypothetical protein